MLYRIVFVVAACLARVASVDRVTFTGNVPVDFPSDDPDLFLVVDTKFPITFLGGPSGWNIVDVRFIYDHVEDVGYLGTTR